MEVMTFADFVQRANAIPEPDYPKDPWGRSDDLKIALYQRVIDIVGDERELAWGTMTYACAGETPDQRGCGFEHKVWMGIGVEGPPQLKETAAYVPSPFFCGRCPACGLGLQHIRWNDDEEFDAPREVPDDVSRFIVPTIQQARDFVETGYGGAEYIDPSGQTTSNRKS